MDRVVLQDEMLAEQLGALMPRRFTLWVVAWAMLWLVGLLANGWEGIIALVIIGTGWAWQRWLGGTNRANEIRTAFWMLIGVAAVGFIFGAFHIGGADPTAQLLWVGVQFLLAASILPMTFRQALRPAIAIMIMWAIERVWTGSIGEWYAIIFALLGASTPLWPGLVVSLFRTTSVGRKFEARMLRSMRDEYRREVLDAQRLHEAIFPKSNTDGIIKYRYRDSPRLGIGGDFLHAVFDESKRLHLVLLDVSGSGISAALTVHRLQGEIERLLAEDATLDPDEALTALDHYALLTLAPIGVYAVAMFFRIHESGLVEYSGAGHAPAYIRRADGSVERLESTTWPLGASDEPDPLQQLCTTRLETGDVLIASTDGACDEQDESGNRLWFSGLEAMIREGGGQTEEDPLRWPEEILHRIARYRGDDDVVEGGGEDVLVVAAQVDVEHDSTRVPVDENA